MSVTINSGAYMECRVAASNSCRAYMQMMEADNMGVMYYKTHIGCGIIYSIRSM